MAPGSQTSDRCAGRVTKSPSRSGTSPSEVKRRGGGGPIEADAFAALSTAYEFLARVMAAVRHGVIVLDPRGAIIQVNPAAVDLIGLDESELVGQPYTCFFAPPHLERVRSSLEALVAGGAVVRDCEARLRRPDGTEADVLLGLEPLADEAGVTAVVATVQDVTQRRITEEALRRSQRELEFRIEERTAGFLTANDLLRREIEERRRVEAALVERVKELDCLYGISRLGEDPTITLEEVLEETVRLIPPAFQEPHLTSARLSLEGREFSTADFVPTDSVIGSDILVAGERVGRIEVAGQGAKPFLPEEQRLVAAVAERMGRLAWRHRTSESLRQSQSRFRALFDQMSSGVAVYRAVDEGRDFVFTDFNRAAERIDGLDRSEVLGRRLTEVFPGAVDFGLVALLARVWQTGRPERQSPGLYRDGEREGWREHYVYQLPSGEVVAIYDDRSAQMRAEEALRKSEQRYRELFETSLDGVVLTGSDQGVLAANPEACRMFGRSLSELRQSRREEVVDVTGRRYRAGIEALAATGRFVGELTFRRADGSTFPAEVSATQFIGPGGEERINLIIRDLTERKRAETRDQARQEQLFQAAKMVSLGTLVSGVAHEINNPNNFILLNSRIIADAWRDARPVLEDAASRDPDLCLAGIPARGALDRIDRLVADLSEGALRIQKIVNSLRDFGRKDTGRLDERVEIGAVVESAMTIIGNLVRKRTDRFTARVGPDLPPVKGSRQRLEQVVINLITNAARALTGPHQAITVLAGLDPDRGRVRLEVADEGRGIPPEVLPRILDPFYTTERGSGGVGLGLSISYGIVREHGGELTFVSTPGQGTTAVVTLPAWTPDDREDSR